MPETCFPIRTRSQARRPSPLPMLLLLGAVLGGCSGGDFGRSRQDVRNDDMHRCSAPRRPAASGSRRRNSNSPTRTAAPRLCLSPDRAAAFAPAWKSVFGDYKPLPSPWRQAVVFDRTAYGRLLIDEPRGHESR